MGARFTVIALLAGWCAVGGLIGVAVAAVAESRFTISPDGAHVDFAVREVPRRDVLERLFADRGIKLEWLDRAFADESISGTFKGTPTSVARHLLDRANFVIVYGRKDDTFQISRIVVIGRADKGRASPGLAAIGPAVQPGTSRQLPRRPASGPGTAAREKQAAPPQRGRPDAARADRSPPRLQSNSAALGPRPLGGAAGSTSLAAGMAGPAITPSATPAPVPTPVPAGFAGPTLTPAPPGSVGPTAAPFGTDGPVPFPVQRGATGL